MCIWFELPHRGKRWSAAVRWFDVMSHEREQRINYPLSRSLSYISVCVHEFTVYVWLFERGLVSKQKCTSTVSIEVRHIQRLRPKSIQCGRSELKTTHCAKRTFSKILVVHSLAENTFHVFIYHLKMVFWKWEREFVKNILNNTGQQLPPHGFMPNLKP